MSPGLQASSQVLLKPGCDLYATARPGAVQPCPRRAPGDPAGGHWAGLGNSSPTNKRCVRCSLPRGNARPNSVPDPGKDSTRPSAGKTGPGAGRGRGQDVHRALASAPATQGGEHSRADSGAFEAPSPGELKPTASSQRRPSRGPRQAWLLKRSRTTDTQQNHRHVSLPRLAKASSRCAPHQGVPPTSHQCVSMLFRSLHLSSGTLLSYRRQLGTGSGAH